MRQRRCRGRRRPEVLRELRGRHRRVRRGQRTAVERRERAADRGPDRTGAGARRTAGRPGAAPGRSRSCTRGHHAALGRRRRQRRSGAAAGRSEVPRSEHDGRHTRHRGRHRRDAPRPPRHTDRHHDLPAGVVHRAVDRQPHAGPGHRRAPGDLHSRCVPVPAAHGVHQPHRDSAVAHLCPAGARRARRDGQRDGPRGSGGRHRRGSRRRDHRRRERRAAPSAGAGGGERPVGAPHRARRVGRGPQRHHVCHGHQRRGDRPGPLPRGLVRIVLRSAGALVRTRRAGEHAGRHDGDAGAVRHPPVPWPVAAPRRAASADPEAGLRVHPRGDPPPAGPDGRCRGRVPAGRGPDPADARESAAPELQGARLPYALADRAVHLCSGGDAHLTASLQ